MDLERIRFGEKHEEKQNDASMNVQAQLDLWKRVLEALDFHKKKHTPIHALNRLFHEHREDLPGVQLNNTTCNLSCDSRSTEQLSQFKRHTRCNPADETYPILVVRYEDTEYLIDGGNRINKWVNAKDTNLHDVIVIEFVGQIMVRLNQRNQPKIDTNSA
jgi:hypothetical protein